MAQHKKTIIKKIQAIIKEHGNFTTGDVSAESSPSVSNRKLCESFDFDNAEVVTYDRNDDEVDSEQVSYYDLKKDVLENILALAEDWEVECLQDEDRQGGF